MKVNGTALIVYEHLKDLDFGVVELAAALHVSEATLRRRLAEQAKFTPAAFIQHCKLEQARVFVNQGNMRNIAELSQAVGFSWTKLFRSPL